MKKLLVLVILLIAGWQAREHWNDLVGRKPAHEVVVVNDSGRILESLRVTVGGQTFVKERLDPHARAVFHFHVASDASFALVWQWSDSTIESRWSGGSVPAGPMVQRHRIEVHDDNSVIYTSEPLPAR